jgi:hypothetical protein
VTFDTFSTNGAVVIEIEDYNYDSGQFIDNPTPGAYANFVGTAETDYHTVGAVGNAFRPANPLEIFEALETRPYFIAAEVPNYAVSSLNVDDWLNYTRTFPNGSYQVYLRYGSLEDQSLQLDLVTGDRTQPNQSLTPIGVLNAPEINSEAIYRYTSLTDTNGAPITVHLSGVQTLRLTGSDVQPEGLVADFFILVPVAGQPRLTIIPGAGSVTLSFPTETGRTYTLQYKNALTDAVWQNALPSINGDGSTQSISQQTTVASRFYRLAVQ